MQVFSTPRLKVRTATSGDIDFYYQLWTNPQVMRFVGFPRGLQITRAEIQRLIEKPKEDPPFACLLVIVLKETEEVIGECKMYRPDPAGISETDVKLLPVHWGQGYGTEVKQALVDYLFAHTDCQAVQGTPNVANIASIKMQEAVGGVCVGEDVFTLSESSQPHTIPVPHYIYRVYRPGTTPPDA